MAKETEKNQEKSLQAIDTAIASLRTQDWDLNPYSVAAAAELEPEDVFNNKAAMDKIMAARGDGSTYSHDAVLAGRCKELEAELDNAASINQDLYDRGSELAERVLELEASVAELEQEAETLALQLQNSWSLGYQKGLAEGREQALLPPEQRLESQQKPHQKPASKTGEHPVVEAEANKSETEATKSEVEATKSTAEATKSDLSAKITDEDLPTESQLKSSLNQQPMAEEAQPGLSTPADPVPAKTAPVQQPAAEPALAIVDTAGYNDRVYNAVTDHRSPISVSEIYGALSWKQIETVYQYSTVAGRPNTNLYFEPLSSEPEQERAAAEQPVAVEEQPAIAKEQAVAAPEQPVAAKEQAVAAPEQPVAAKEPAGAPAKSDEESAVNSRSAQTKAASKLPHISFDPPEEPIVGAPQSKPIVRSSDMGEPDFINQYDGGLTGENFPSLDSLQAAAAARKDTSTYDKLDALPAKDGEVPDILDLDQLDIFEGMEDIDELSKIEVIEDVVLAAPNANIISQSETAAMPKVSGEDLRDLIKTRIKQAQDHDPHQQHSLDQLLDAANAPGVHEASSETSNPESVKSAAPSATEEIPSTGAIDLEALRHGARNKFVGGKSPSTSTPPNASASPTGETAVPNPGPAAAGAPTPRVAPIPADIRKHCMMLGVRADELTVKIVIEAWKAQITAPGVHPDQGGDTETAVYLNLAKDSLIKYIEAQAPKLGKKFGQPSQARDSQSKPFTMRQGPDKDTDKK